MGCCANGVNKGASMCVWGKNDQKGYRNMQRERESKAGKDWMSEKETNRGKRERERQKEGGVGGAESSPTLKSVYSYLWHAFLPQEAFQKSWPTFPLHPPFQMYSSTIGKNHSFMLGLLRSPSLRSSQANLWPLVLPLFCSYLLNTLVVGEGVAYRLVHYICDGITVAYSVYKYGKCATDVQLIIDTS